jgi:L-amino acid N-acyltransferase YncA
MTVTSHKTGGNGTFRGLFFLQFKRGKQNQHSLNKEYNLRLITPDDAKATLAIYAPYVLQLPVSFEYEVPGLQEWESRISAYAKICPWLVCECQERVVGYAYAGRHRDRTAYAWSAEAAIYLANDFHGQGIAAALYNVLFELLKLQGYVNVLAGITIPNGQSENFHRRMGFQEVGVYKKIGYKFGAWHDVRWLQLSLMEHPALPQTPKPFSDLRDTEAVQGILQAASAGLNKARRC